MVVFKIPYDSGGGIKSFGAKYGPNAIEAQFKRWSWRVAEDGTPHPPISFHDVAKQTYKEESIFDSYAAALRLTLSQGARSFISLSGDNSVSFHTAKLTAECFPDPTLVLLDAHLDACDRSHDPHASWVRRLWESGIVRPQKTFLFGIRDPEEDEIRFVKESGATIVLCEEFSRVSPTAIVSNLLLAKKIVPLAVLILVVDIDVLDPSQAPGTGVLRSPGMELRHALQLVREFGKLPFTAKVGEITEVIPCEGDFVRPPDDRRPDPNGLTLLAAEAILREMIRSFAEKPA